MSPLTSHPEFHAGASTWDDAFSRRDFLRLMSASLALAGLGACTRQPREEILPYVQQPEILTPGESLYFATSMELGGRGAGLLVRSDAGRPTKIEGNPDHPASRGRTSVPMQAALLTLYDPHRSTTARKNGQPALWEEFLAEVSGAGAEWKQNGGAGLRLLTRTVGSPTLREQIAALLEKYPRARWHQHDPAFSIQTVSARPNFERADIVVSLDADFLGDAIAPAAALAYFERRQSGPNPSRLYAVESMPSMTGAMADHHLAVRPSEIPSVARQLWRAIQEGTPPADRRLAALVQDLLAHRERSLVLAGDFHSPELTAITRAINDTLGNIGKTVEYVHADQAPIGTLAELVSAMLAGEVHTLVILGGNPVYDAPADLEFASALARVPNSIHHGGYVDETATRCRWHIPESHFLEAWSDTVASDGTLALTQPLIEPLYASHTAHTLFAALHGDGLASSYEILRASWQRRLGRPDFEKQWRKTLHDGKGAKFEVRREARHPSQDLTENAAPPPSESLELVIRPDPFLLDGRFAENAWLQELPRPITKLTWENAAYLGTSTAKRLGLSHGDIVELQYRGRSVHAPVWILPGHAEDCVTIHLGHGRTRAGEFASGAGFNAFALQTSDAPWGGAGLQLRKTGQRHVFATTQEHQRMEGREPVQVLTFSKRGEIPHATAPPPEESLYPKVEYGSPSWGMAIDLDRCIGCAVCTVACQAENNIPVVGREQVLRGREMHWIRVDTYFRENSQIVHQPVPCMHCENAPCELVCPVAATVHDSEGLNVMVYNRCIGTRYCSNNCPYKVRRFNFLEYHGPDTPQSRLRQNPRVSVRMRGVMEKCTYCVQRISAARIAAEKDSRPIRDGEAVPACAQACPTDAIVFGDICDPQSRVAHQRASTRHYDLLAELNTRPRTTYLARVRNPHPGWPEA
jgi:molybdopterin-containing oxidoreductase family iron-sulfur binding subunit